MHRDTREILRQTSTVGAVGLEMGLAVAIGMGLGYLIGQALGSATTGLIVGLFFGLGAAAKAVQRVYKDTMADFDRADFNKADTPGSDSGDTEETLAKKLR
ncbi:AtpZ/AtpI family protein [bacterium]|nr:AtpZ/AtpI family protein [bacterium]